MPLPAAALPRNPYDPGRSAGRTHVPRRGQPGLAALFRSLAVFLGIWTASLPVATHAAEPASNATGDANADDLALPAAFALRIRDRKTIDTYQQRHLRLEPVPAPAVMPPPGARRRMEQAVRVVRRPTPPHPERWTGVVGTTNPLPRGFRAPILGHQEPGWPVPTDAAPLLDAELAARAAIQKRLAHDGLLRTLAQVLEHLGAGSAAADPPGAVQRLHALGFPVDLLRHFRMEGGSATSNSAPAIVGIIARALAAGNPREAIVGQLDQARFDFVPTDPGFTVALAGGEQEVGLLRMQIGGGWRDGIVHGDMLHAVGQIADAFPAADFLIGVPAEFADLMASMIANTWRLRRKEQLTLCVEPGRVTAWAQDNGKAGFHRDAAGNPSRHATLAPRYACVEEGHSLFEPSESLAAEGWRAAGHHVLQSPLLFQGGNLLAVRAPRTGERLLLLGEGEVHRNVPLGLSRAQVILAFQREFGVDRCVVVPAVSYHLDFDLSVRTLDKESLAFVNDTPKAARIVVGLGIAALGRHGILNPQAAASAQEQLRAERDAEWIPGVAEALSRHRSADGTHATTVSKAFAAQPFDDTAVNLRIFLVALDVLASRLTLPSLEPRDPERAAYFGALRRTEDARRVQIDALRELGFRIVPVPSMSELNHSVNSLNGIQHRGGFVMPVVDGFYASLDRAAIAVFQEAMGPAAKITVIRTAQCQSRHGGVHCLASAYPTLGAPAPSP